MKPMFCSSSEHRRVLNGKIKENKKLSTYIINGGHQQQDDGGNVHDNDSSQHQHRGLLKTDSRAMEEGRTPLFSFHTHM